MTSSASILIREKSRTKSACKSKAVTPQTVTGGFRSKSVLWRLPIFDSGLLEYWKLFRKSGSIPDDRRDPEFYTFPVDFIRQHHDKCSWEKIRARKLEALGVDFPVRVAVGAAFDSSPAPTPKVEIPSCPDPQVR
jgi:hypothetical protein